MPINSFDHYTIRCADLDKTWAFYQDVLGLRVETRSFATRPNNATANFPRAAIVWFPGGDWFVHIFQSSPEQEAVFARMAPQDEETARWQTGRMHHISVKATGYKEMTAKLTEAGVNWREFTAAERHLVQFQDPDGIEVELTFPSAELA